jgi:hypothetical protein
LYNYNHSTAVLYGGDYTGRGGNQTGGAGAALHSTLTAYDITALAEDGDGDIGNYALGCYDHSTATLHGGDFIARGRVNNYALSNELTVTMEAYNVTALAENGSDSNYGLWNVNNATLVLHGASLIGRGGTNAYGLSNQGTGTMLQASGVTALGENGSNNYGLHNDSTATANVTQGVLEGATYSVLQSSGVITVSNSRLAGNGVSGTVTCVLVTRGTNVSTDGSSCP